MFVFTKIAIIAAASLVYLMPAVMLRHDYKHYVPVYLSASERSEVDAFRSKMPARKLKTKVLNQELMVEQENQALRIESVGVAYRIDLQTNGITDRTGFYMPVVPNDVASVLQLLQIANGGTPTSELTQWLTQRRARHQRLERAVETFSHLPRP